MKLSFFILFALVSVAVASPTPTPSQNNIPSRAALLATVDHISRLAKDLQSNLDKEKAAHTATEKALASATSQAVTLQNAINAQSDQLNKAITERDHILKQLHLLKVIASVVATGLIIVGLLYAGIMPPLLFYIGGAAIAAVNFYIWWKL